MIKHLKRVKKGLDANRLALNIDKTNFVLFHTNQKKETEPVIKIWQEKICQENCVYFLCILLDSALSWKYRSAVLAKRLARTSGIFFKIRNLIPFGTINLLYHSFPFSYIMVPLFGVLHLNVL